VERRRRGERAGASLCVQACRRCEGVRMPAASPSRAGDLRSAARRAAAGAQAKRMAKAETPPAVSRATSRWNRRRQRYGAYAAFKQRAKTREKRQAATHNPPTAA